MVGKERDFQPAGLFLRQRTPPSWFREKGNVGLNKGRRREFAGKPKGMNKQTRKTKLLEDGLITAPGQSMHHNQILDVLRQHGFAEGRLIAFSKSGYRKYYRSHFVVFNAQIFSRRSRVLKTADLDLTLDAEKLTQAARATGENFFVLEENSPNPFWQPGSTPMDRVLRDAVWWTRIRREDEDLFLPLDAGPLRRKRVRLNCSMGRWQNQPAYSVDLWNNPEWESGRNLSGAVVQVLGRPPKGLRPKVKNEVFTAEISKTRGRPVRPVFYHRTGLLEYVWFSHRAAVPAILYDQTVRLLDSVSFTSHRDNLAIHLRQAGEVVGLFWPCDISAPEVLANARWQLNRRFGENTATGGNRR